MFPSISDRVIDNTCQEVNHTIERETVLRLQDIAQEGPAAIQRRLQELDAEWDIERVLETNAASVSLLGLTLGALVDRRWYALPAVVAGFLLQHAIQGWCPPLPAFRRLGVRTQVEIDRERYALKIMRGDFEKSGLQGGTSTSANRAYAASRR